MPSSKIPEGYSTITPSLIVADASKAIELYVKAFGAKEISRAADPKTGKIIHACIQIGSSKVFMCDANPEMSMLAATTSNFYLYMEDVDSIFRQATQAGLQEVSPVQDMFWGDRTGSGKDRFGNRWSIATHIRDVSPQEMAEAIKKLAAKAA